jgi:hypothetical protein
MSDELPDGGFSEESLGDDPVEQARRQLALLEKSLGAGFGAAAASAVFDEAYRAAHTLRTAIDPQRMTNVDRLARRVQDIVRATRSGSLGVTAELAAVLSSVVRIARDALDAVSSGGSEPLSAASASASLEELLAHPGAWTMPPALSGAPVQWARIDGGRLIGAGETAGDARAASVAYARAAREFSSLMDRLGSSFEGHELAVHALREALPAALARAARGEATAAIAAELAELAGNLSVGAEDLKVTLGRSAAALHEAALLGVRAADKAEAAFGSLRSVRLDALCEDFRGFVQRTARNAGSAVDLEQEATNLEVNAARAESVLGALKACVRALIGSGRPRGKKAGRGAADRAAVLSIHPRAAGEDIFFRITLAGAAVHGDRLEQSVAALQRVVKREGGTIEAQSTKGGSASMLLSFRSAAGVTSRVAEFLFARAGDAWYAILASAVVECIPAGLSSPDHLLEGTRIPTLRMNDTRDPQAGVVVRTPRGGAVLLFDSIGGREFGVETLGGERAEEVSGISGTVRRPDGSSVPLVDLGVLLPEKPRVHGPAAPTPKKDRAKKAPAKRARGKR